MTDVQSQISTENGKAYGTQWFERAKYEAHPENQAPYDVLLGRLGATVVEGRGAVDPATGKVRNPADAAFVGIDQPGDIGATKLYFPETKHSVSGKILQYWNQYGGLSQFGYPLSEAFDEISDTDGKTYSVQYFEGSLIVPPGGVLALLNTVSSVTHSVTARLLWEEVPV